MYRNLFSCLTALAWVAAAPAAVAATAASDPEPSGASLGLSRTRIAWDFLHGECVFGEPVSATLELCNVGAVPALNFQPGMIFGGQDYISFLVDPVAASSPQTCHAPSSPNFEPCAPVEGVEPVCAAQVCRLQCEKDSDCPSSFSCLSDRFLGSGEKSCMYRIDPGAACREFQVEGRIPLHNKLGERLLAGDFHLHFLGDTQRSLGEAAPDIWSTDAFFCKEALPDLTVASLSAPARAMAGEAIAVHRHLRNLAYVAPGEDGERHERMSFRYRYYLRSAGSSASPLAIPLPLQATGDAGMASIGVKGDDVLTEMVVLPRELPEGLYTLSLFLDPDEEVVETDEHNNLFSSPTPIDVRPSSFRIVSLALPTAREGGLYLHQFVALGGLGALRWSAQGLPRGLSITSDGLLQGVPSAAGTYAFSVQVVSGDRSASAWVALRVQEPLGVLGVATAVLPPAIRGQPYGGYLDAQGKERSGVPLAASGGEAPYTWELAPRDASDRLPQGLLLQTPEGILVGEASPLSRTSTFVVQVRDAQGATATAALELRVVDDGTPVIATRLFDEALAGRPYQSCLEATGGDRSGGYVWTIGEESIPAGLAFEGREGSGCLVGTPSICGNYLIDVEVTDTANQTFRSQIPLSVGCDVIRIHNELSRSFARGETVEIELGSNAGEGALFRLFQGGLPAGLELQPEGWIAGTIAADAAFASYDFIVEARDAAGREGLTALSLRVAEEPREPRREERSSSGCGAAGGGQGLLCLALAAGALSRIRRSRPRPGRGGVIPSAAWMLLSLGLWSCGGETEIIVHPLCYEVSCADGLECDPTDGQCKCGGLGGTLCGPGQACLPEPTPHCGTVSCEFVVCERGQSCEAATGRCSCNGAQCTDGESCVAGTCTVQSRCEEQRCGGPLVCDPADGQCKCGGVVCAANESCIEGGCTVDRCAGVHCPGALVCDPEDGVCHCGGVGGPICRNGEACVSERGVVAEEEGQPARSLIDAACVDSDRCESVRCGVGTVCDPADGACRCGGVGKLAPACTSEQICLNGSCVGGDLCATVACAPGFSCDGLDGRCKCGGAGGVTCQEEEVCTLEEGAFACAAPCTLGAGGQGCGEGKACYLDRNLAHGRAFCAPVGPMMPNDPCLEFNDCAPGLFCSSANLCRRLCHPSEPAEIGCGGTPGALCLPFSPAESAQPDMGYCITNFG